MWTFHDIKTSWVEFTHICLCVWWCACVAVTVTVTNGKSPNFFFYWHFCFAALVKMNKKHRVMTLRKDLQIRPKPTLLLTTLHDTERLLIPHGNSDLCGKLKGVSNGVRHVRDQSIVQKYIREFLVKKWYWNKIALFCQFCFSFKWEILLLKEAVKLRLILINRSRF